MKIVILYSGGVDSHVLYHYLKKEYPEANVVAIYYNFGQHYATWEIEKLPDFVSVREVEWLQYDKTVHVDPDKNGIMWGREQFLTVLSYMQEKPDMICLGVLADEWAEDMSERHQSGTQEFMKLLNPHGIECVVSYPFAEMGWEKLDVVRWAHENSIDPSNTVTCMVSKEPCGKCSGCKKRASAFSLA